MTFLKDLYASFVIFCSNFNARFGRLVNWTLLVLAVALVAVFVVRTARLSIRAKKTERRMTMPPRDEKREQNLCKLLAAAVQIPTVTGDWEGLDRLYELLKQRFPRVFGTMRVTRLESGALLLHWRSPDSAGKKPVLLCAHADVVPVEGQNWTTGEPFSGKISDGFVYGRGALDCKNVLIGLLSAAEGLLEEGFAPGRDIYYAFGCDEETGGEQGAKAIAQELRHRGLHFEFILDEGSNITTEHLGAKDFPAALLGVAEKGAATFRLTARAKAGHAAMPPAHTAVGLLAEAICRIEAAPMHKRLLPVMRQCLERSAPAMGLLAQACVANLPATKHLLYHSTRHNLQVAALLHTTFAVTQASGAPAANVLPETAQATVNARILQGDTGEGVLAYLQALLADLPVTVEMLSCMEPSPVTPPLGPVYQIITAAVEDTFGRLPCIPTVMPAGTDTKHYQEFSDHIFRFLPFVTDPQTFSTVHGADERIGCQSFAAGVTFYERLLKKL